MNAQQLLDPLPILAVFVLFAVIALAAFRRRRRDALCASHPEKSDRPG